MYERDFTFDFQPIEIKTHPFQQTSQPEEFNIIVFASAISIGMIFVLVPVSLSIDMVYEREVRHKNQLLREKIYCFLSMFQVKVKNQLRVNGLSFFMYFFTYFVVLAGLMVIIVAALLVLILVFDVPSLSKLPAFCTFAVLTLIYCPSSVLFSTCVSYIFDKMDSAMSILPNISTFVGLIPFCLVIFLDMLRIGK